MEMDQQTGISIMKIVQKLDAGPYMMQKSVSINIKDNYLSLTKKLSEIGSKLILEALKLFEKNETKFVDQDDNLATYAKKITKKEAKINWNDTAQKLIAKINGLSPYPGAWFMHKDSRIKIIEAEASSMQGTKGEVLTNDLVIGCHKNSIKINLLQKEGKKTLNTKSFLAGYKINKGELLL